MHVYVYYAAICHNKLQYSSDNLLNIYFNLLLNLVKLISVKIYIIADICSNVWARQLKWRVAQ